MDNKKLIIIIVSLLSLFWSIWFWTSFPTSFKSPAEINKFCIEDPVTGSAHNSEYCIGYEEGYDWAVAQVEIQKKIDGDF